MTVTTLFPLGRLCATPAALDALTNANSHPLELLWRHARGDWGTSAQRTSRRTEASPRFCSRRTT